MAKFTLIGRDPRLLPELEFGALLSYSPRGDSAEASLSRYAMNLLKNEGFIPSKPQGPLIPMSEWIARNVEQSRSALPFAGLFERTPVLVPAPRSSLLLPNSLWVSERLATAFVNAGLGTDVGRYLRRVRAVPRAALSAPQNRPKPAQHYETIAVEPGLSKPPEIVLMDDIVTRGATLLGAASRLAEAFPGVRIRGFAAMRTVSEPSKFKKTVDPCIGRVRLLPNNETLRDP